MLVLLHNADDVVLLAPTRTLLKICDNHAKEYNIHVMFNAEKSK